MSIKLTSNSSSKSSVTEHPSLQAWLSFSRQAPLLTPDQTDAVLTRIQNQENNIITVTTAPTSAPSSKPTKK